MVTSAGEQDLDHFADCLRTHHCHNLSWPQGMTDALYNRTWVEFSWQVFNLFKYPSVAANAQVGIGFLLKDIWRVCSSVVLIVSCIIMHCSVPQNINSSVQGKEVQKFLLFSGHDTTCESVILIPTALWLLTVLPL